MTAFANNLHLRSSTIYLNVSLIWTCFSGSRKFHQIHMKTPSLESLFNKVAHSTLVVFQWISRNFSVFIASALGYKDRAFRFFRIIRKLKNDFFPYFIHWGDKRLTLANQWCYRNNHQRCHIKKLFWKISQYSQENICVGVCFHKETYSNSGAFRRMIRDV